MKLSAERRYQFSNYGISMSAVLLISSLTVDFLLSAYYSSHPSWIRFCFYEVIVAFFLTPASAILSLFGLGWKRWVGLSLAMATTPMIFFACTAG